MRQRFALVLAAGGRWPGADGGHNLPQFNWAKVDNKGTGSVDVSLNANPTAGDKVDTMLTVPAGVCRVFNVGGPKTGGSEDPSGSGSWPQELFLVSAAGTTVYLEIADHPIVDLVDLLTAAPPASGSSTVTIGSQPIAVTPGGQASGTDITASGTGPAQANNVTLAGVAAKTTYISGFEITGSGATAATVVAVTITGTIGGTLNYSLFVPAIASNFPVSLDIEFIRPIPASAVNTPIVVNVPSFGAGNTGAAVTAHGFQL